MVDIVNSKQRRKKKRAWVRRYPYLVETATIIGYNIGTMEAYRWCRDNIKDTDWTTNSNAPKELRTTHGFRFTYEKDAVLFTLLWSEPLRGETYVK